MNVVSNFEKITGLRLRFIIEKGIWYECSGKSYENIKNRINKYNKDYNKSVRFYDDELKDVTVITHIE